MRTLVIGASGILAPAAAALVRAGDAVTGVGRTRPVPEGVETLHLDARSAPALAYAIADRHFDRALVYAPAVTADSLSALAGAVSGRTVLIRTSASADPARGELVLPEDTLQLGWTDTESGGVRWHSPEQVSDAALAVLSDGRARVLGRVRPWGDKP